MPVCTCFPISIVFQCIYDKFPMHFYFVATTGIGFKTCTNLNLVAGGSENESTQKRKKDRERRAEWRRSVGGVSIRLRSIIMFAWACLGLLGLKLMACLYLQYAYWRWFGLCVHHGNRSLFLCLPCSSWTFCWKLSWMCLHTHTQRHTHRTRQQSKQCLECSSTANRIESGWSPCRLFFAIVLFCFRCHCFWAASDLKCRYCNDWIVVYMKV